MSGALTQRGVGQVSVTQRRAHTARLSRRSGARRSTTRWVIGVLAFMVLLVVVWLSVTGLLAYRELQAVKAATPAAEQAIRAGAGADDPAVVTLVDHARNAYAQTHDPVWATAAALPWLGAPLDVVRSITQAGDAIASNSLTPIAAALREIDPQQLMSEGTLDVAALRRSQPSLEQAAVVIDQQRVELQSVGGSWLPPVAAARTELLDVIDPLADTAVGAATAAQLLPPMLGADGVRRYFLGFQNTAEARGTGGYLGAFAVVRAEAGKVTIERTGSHDQLPAFVDEPQGLSDEFLAQYGPQGGATAWFNANLSPDFPEVARAWAGMWTAATGQKVDGAISLNPRALAAILRATGPVKAPGVGTVSSSQVENLIHLEQYQRTSDPLVRKRLMVGVGVATIEALLHGKAAYGVVSEQLATVGQDGDALVYSTDETEQALLEANGVAGAVDQSSRPFAQAIVVNAGGNKLDTWLHSALTYDVVSCNEAGRTVDVTVTLRNDVPRTGLPPYVTVRSDAPPFTTLVGQSRVELQVLSTLGAQFTSATIDGRSVGLEPKAGALPESLPDGLANSVKDALYLAPGKEGLRPSYGINLELPPGATRTMVIRWVEPAGPEADQAPLLPLQRLANVPTAQSLASTCPSR